MLFQTPLNREVEAFATGPVVHDETRWRRSPAPDQAAKIVASRWTAANPGSREESAPASGTHYTLAIALRLMQVTFSLDGRTLHDGRVLPGMLQLTAPGQSCRAVFRGPCDVLHLHIPETLLRECLEIAQGQAPTGEQATGEQVPGDLALVDPCFSQDPVIERLGRALLAAVEMGDTVGALYADAVGLAIATRLLSQHSAGGLPTAKRTPLPKWRLKRALDFIEAHLADPLTLADIAQATGLTRMHFAAQFRAATGLRPHEYLLRRRIERAQDLLSGSDTTLVDVAFSVGFQTQSHFTTVFKRFAGDTPHQWRRRNGRDLPVGVLPPARAAACELTA